MGRAPGSPRVGPARRYQCFVCKSDSLCVYVRAVIVCVFSVRTTASTMYRTVTIAEDDVAEESRRLTKCETGVFVVVTMGCYLISAFGMWAIVKLAH